MYTALFHIPADPAATQQQANDAAVLVLCFLLMLMAVFFSSSFYGMDSAIVPSAYAEAFQGTVFYASLGLVLSLMTCSFACILELSQRYRFVLAVLSAASFLLFAFGLLKLGNCAFLPYCL